jgi:glycosyltransferase involved in cell wall biosynthesis
LYAALGAYGVKHVPDVPLTWKDLTGQRPPVDILHLHWPEPYWREPEASQKRQAWRVRRLGRLLSRLRNRGLRIVWTVHNLEHHEGTGAADWLGYELLHAMTDLRILHSEWSRRVAADRFGGPGDTIVMLHGNYVGVLPEPHPREETLAALGIPGDRRVLLCAGQLRRYKGFEIALDAMILLRDDPCHLIVAGRPVDSTAEELSSRAPSLQNVTLLPREVEDQELADLFQAADAALLPYLRVTGSGVLMHALTSSRSVVASDLPYFREMLAGEPNAGVLVEPGDPDSLARGIRAALDVPDEHRRAAAQRITERHDWQRVVRPYADWLVSVISDRQVPT